MKKEVLVRVFVNSFIILILAIFVLHLSFAAECNDHKDNNGDGFCDYPSPGAYCSDGSLLGDYNCNSPTDTECKGTGCAAASSNTGSFFGMDSNTPVASLPDNNPAPAVNNMDNNPAPVAGNTNDNTPAVNTNANASPDNTQSNSVTSTQSNTAQSNLNRSFLQDLIFRTLQNKDAGIVLLVVAVIFLICIIIEIIKFVRYF